jgi:hypothetical protein
LRATPPQLAPSCISIPWKPAAIAKLLPPPPQELFPGNFAPTLAHVFMKLLHDKGLLLRVCEGRRAAVHGC